MKYLYYLTFLAVLFVFATLAHAEETCPQFFVKEQIPVLINKTLANNTTPLCYMEFGVLYSGVSRTPIWSAEHLTAEHIEIGQGLPRHNNFHEEERVPINERSTLNDYKRSGYDRGHMAPNGDMSSKMAKEETFTLANMVPQAPCNNEVLWEGIESAVRDLVWNVNDVYIVTGPAFIGSEINSLKGRVLVPTHVWKAVYIPSRNEAMAYWSTNNNHPEWEIINLAELQKRTGVDVFPALTDEQKNANVTLPAPNAPHHRCRVYN